MRMFLLLGIGCVLAIKGFTQPLFTYGKSQVSKDEFINSFTRNITQAFDKEQALKEYLKLYTKYKLKVKYAKDLKLDTLEQFKYDVLNFHQRLENDFPFNIKEALLKTNPKINPAVDKEALYRFADSVTLLPWNHPYAIEKETVLTLGNGTSVKAKEWLSFVKAYKLNYEVYRGESYPVLLDSFIIKSACKYYRNHLEDYNTDFKYRLQEFAEGNLMYEVMDKNVWQKSANDIAGVKAFYENNKQRFLWKAAVDAILVNTRYYAYADYAFTSIKDGMDWRKIAAASEGMILADSGRYEIEQLPLKPGVKVVEGALSEILKNEKDSGAAFIKVIKVYPVKMQRSFGEAKNMVITEYQKQLEEAWLDDLLKKYPVKINDSVFRSLIK